MGAMNRDFVLVGPSRIEGLGVFAKRQIPRGARIIEYAGARVPIDDVRGVYSMALDDDFAVDGSRNGNDARLINHSCAPNCEAYVFEGRAYIYAMRDILLGEELTYDYRLGLARPTGTPFPQDTSLYRCLCGAVNCRGTLLAPTGDLA